MYVRGFTRGGRNLLRQYLGVCLLFVSQSLQTAPGKVELRRNRSRIQSPEIVRRSEPSPFSEVRYGSV
jgi:hypothetical protein